MQLLKRFYLTVHCPLHDIKIIHNFLWKWGKKWHFWQLSPLAICYKFANTHARKKRPRPGMKQERKFLTYFWCKILIRKGPPGVTSTPLLGFSSKLASLPLSSSSNWMAAIKQNFLESQSTFFGKKRMETKEKYKQEIVVCQKYFKKSKHENSIPILCN